MQKERKIALVVKKSTVEQAEEDYLFFWADKTVSERLEELVRLKKNGGAWDVGSYPAHIEKVVLKRTLHAGK